MARLRSHDQGFVAAAPGRVHAALRDPAGYPGWWPGTAVRGGELELPLARHHAAVPERERDGLGLHLMFGGDSLEWYLEPFEEGTVVNAFLEVDGPRSDRALLRMRGEIRRGLVGLKKKLERQA